ncbi:hypothetical protein LTR84_007446 [Exophiala bonariae]|uniref:N-acetyltransferase domain-containing protein n=1 Tax=Exophiala bonariae TaxID=1690606 RepID=A0AAV9MYA9_9EURO|nr:hypothetical protein LTR84_007446 [Exophiala bonariae]
MEADWSRLSNIFVTETSKHPELFDWLPTGPYDQESYTQTFNTVARNNPGAIIFAILLKRWTVRRERRANGGREAGDENEDGGVEVFEVEDGTFAGTIGLLNTDLGRSRTEMGHIVILPRFQRTFVGTHAHGLLLQHCLNPLSSGGLALRRVQWQANSLNKTSIRAAQRMGYQLEGIMRFERVVPEGKAGVRAEGEAGEGKSMPMVDANGQRLGNGRHSAMLAICWDDWMVGGGRERVLGMMGRD